MKMRIERLYWLAELGNPNNVTRDEIRFMARELSLARAERLLELKKVEREAAAAEPTRSK